MKGKGAACMWTGSEVVFKKKRKNGRKWSEKEEHQNGKKKKGFFNMIEERKRHDSGEKKRCNYTMGSEGAP